MKCYTCKEEMYRSILSKYAFKEYGEGGKEIFLINLEVYKCSKCYETYPIIPHLKGLMECISKFKRGDYEFDGERKTWQPK